LAEQYNRFGERCKYIINEEANLSIFEDDSFDFIYSNIALQHIKPKYSKKYIVEFLRILSPQGLLIFQQPSREKPKPAGQGTGKSTKEIVRNLLPSVLIDIYRNKVQSRQVDGPVMEMYEIRRKDVVALLERHGATVLDISDDMHWSKDWISLRYCVTKQV
jgi:SAM-dependent methyltransferase